jgi:Zn-dependent protease
VLSVIVIRLGLLAGGFFAPDSARFGLIVGAVDGGIWRGAAGLTSIMFSMNLVLACLNILPLPPLDGSAAVVLFMSESTALRYQQFLWTNPMLGAIGMLVAWRAFDVVFHPIFWTVVNLIYPGVGYS